MDPVWQLRLGIECQLHWQIGLDWLRSDPMNGALRTCYLWSPLEISFTTGKWNLSLTLALIATEPSSTRLEEGKYLCFFKNFEDILQALATDCLKLILAHPHQLGKGSLSIITLSNLDVGFIAWPGLTPRGYATWSRSEIWASVLSWPTSRIQDPGAILWDTVYASDSFALDPLSPKQW